MLCKQRCQLAKTYMAHLLVVLSLLLCHMKADKIPPLALRLPNDALQHSFMGRPVCAFFKHAADGYEDLLSRFLQSRTFANNYADWIIGSVDLKDISQATKFSKKPKVVTLSTLENAILNNSNGITIVIFPGAEYFQYMEGIMLKFNRKIQGAHLEILISQPESSRKLNEWFGVKEFPTLLFFTYEVWVEKKTFSYILHGIKEIQPDSIKLSLELIRMRPSFLDENSFRTDILDTRYQLPPKLVCVFSNSNPSSLMYILRFKEIKKQLECQGAELEFRLMNIGEKNNSNVFARHVNASSIKDFPVFVLFWQENTPTYELLNRQIVLDGIPSTNQVYSFLIENSILDNNKRKEYGTCFSDEDEHFLVCVNPYYPRGFCKANTSIYSYDDRYPSRTSRIISKDLEKRKKSSFLKSYTKKHGNLTVLTDDNWPAVVEASSASRQHFQLQEEVTPTLNLVVFIRKSCRYCEMVIPSLEQIAKSILHIDGAALYLLNCSSSPVICNRYDIRGYPSLKLFRSIPWVDVTGCLTNQNKHYIVQDFHGPFQPPELILEWLSNSSLPIIRKEFFLRDVPQKLNHDVYLVGTVITRAQALRFMPPGSHGRWYSFKCFQTVCELLFGKASCYATMTKDFGVSADMEKAKNKDLFVIKLQRNLTPALSEFAHCLICNPMLHHGKLTLFRRDGVQAKIFELGVPLEATLEADRASDLHKFHNVHRYNLPRKFICEESHSLCTEFIVKYVSDHSRLPVTRLSHDGFHTVKRFVNDDDSLQLNDLPIVIVLAHPQNLTNNSTYFQEITKAAHELYRDVIFTALDVDEYPWWASRFVPKDYDLSESFNDLSTRPLYHFPRICVVMTADHHKAAFFPSLRNMTDAANVSTLLRSVTAREIVQFVQHYLLNPEDLLVKTKEF